MSRRNFSSILATLTILLSALFTTAQAQTTGGHSNSFTCTPSADSTATNPGTTNMYIMAGTCPATIDPTTFTKLQTGLPAYCTGTDSGRSPGDTKSYVFTAVINNLESKPSNCVTAITPLVPPTKLNVVAGSSNSRSNISWT